MISKSITRAVVLAAGRGSRLGSLTDDRPKCMVEVGGRPILARTLEALSAAGIKEVVLVVGYRAKQIRAFADTSYAGAEIRYVTNDQHTETGTAYSLWLARAYLDTDLLLLEGDILFNRGLIDQILKSAKDCSVWAAVPIEPGLDEGILLQIGEDDHVQRVELVRDPRKRGGIVTHKCGGVQLLRRALARALSSKLQEAVEARETRVFADLLLGQLIAEHSMRVFQLDRNSWAEVDDEEDLAVAEQLFAAPCARTAGNL